VADNKVSGSRRTAQHPREAPASEPHNPDTSACSTPLAGLNQAFDQVIAESIG
jgi:hypothetical protein